MSDYGGDQESSSIGHMFACEGFPFASSLKVTAMATLTTRLGSSQETGTRRLLQHSAMTQGALKGTNLRGQTEPIFTDSRLFLENKAFARERQRGGQNSGGGQNLTRRTPTESSFRPPLTPVRPPPPNVISLIKYLTNTQNFPQVTPSKTVFGGSPKMVSDGPSLRGFAPPSPVFCPPPFGSAQIWETQIFAENRRKSQKIAENRRNPQKTTDWCLSALTSP